MSDIGDVSKAVSSVSDLISGILERADRDKPEKEFNENIAKIQNAFAENRVDSDEFRLFIDSLLNSTGHSIAPTQNFSMGRREFTHAALIALAELCYAKKILSRLLANKTK